MGYISDNFYNTRLGRRFGRRRFFILLGIPLVLLYPKWLPGNHSTTGPVELLAGLIVALKVNLLVILIKA